MKIQTSVRKLRLQADKQQLCANHVMQRQQHNSIRRTVNKYRAHSARVQTCTHLGVFLPGKQMMVWMLMRRVLPRFKRPLSQIRPTMSRMSSRGMTYMLFTSTTYTYSITTAYMTSPHAFAHHKFFRSHLQALALLCSSPPDKNMNKISWSWCYRHFTYMYKLALCVYEIYLQASFNTLHIWTYTMYKHLENCQKELKKSVILMRHTMDNPCRVCMF